MAARSNPSDITAFRSTFGLVGENAQVVLNGPRIRGSSAPGEGTEADLDVEWSGGIAEGATVKFVVSKVPNVSEMVLGWSPLPLSSTTTWLHHEARLRLLRSERGGESGLNLTLVPGSRGGHLGVCWVPAIAARRAAMRRPLPRATPHHHPRHPTFGATAGFTPDNVAVGGTEFNDSVSPATYWNAGQTPTMPRRRATSPKWSGTESSFTASSFGQRALGWRGGGVSTLLATPWPFLVVHGAPAGHHPIAAPPPAGCRSHGRAGMTAIQLRSQEGGLYTAVGGTTSPSMAGIEATIVNQHIGDAPATEYQALVSLAATNPPDYR